MAANAQSANLMPTLYPGVVAVEPTPFGALGALWLAFQILAANKTPAINGDFFLCLLLRRVRDHPSRWGPVPRVLGAARVGRLPSRLHGRQDRAIIRLS